jgi:DNA-binding CsgD family transcriptional regulator
MLVEPAGTELAAIGLGPAAEAAYELLVDRAPSTVSELTAAWRYADDLTRVLSALETKGLVIRTPDERFAAVAPDVALEALLLSAEKQLQQARVIAGHSVVELVTGTAALRQRVAQVQRSAHRELRCLDVPPYVDSRGTTDVTLELLAQQVVCRTVYDRVAVEQTGKLATIERLADAGEEGRVLPSVPMKLYLSDDRLALLPLQRRPSELEAALVIHPSGLLDALGKLFEGLWQRALPLGLPDASAGAAESERQRLIALLLSGLTDQAIARQLGIGYRTAQRRIAALMTELGATTRFQAGVQAALRARTPAPTDGRQ